MMDPRMAALARAVMGSGGDTPMFQPASAPLNVGPTPVLPIQRSPAGYGAQPTLGNPAMWKQLGQRRQEAPLIQEQVPGQYNLNNPQYG